MIDGQLLDVLAELGVEFERVSSGAYVITLRGPQALHVWLLGGEQDVAVEAFVCHVLEGAATAAAHAYLLQRNPALRGAHFGLDEVGDVFLTGSLSLHDVTADAVDRLLAELWQVLVKDLPRILTLLYGEQVPEKARLDGAGRRAAGTPEWAPRRDARR